MTQSERAHTLWVALGIVRLSSIDRTIPPADRAAHELCAERLKKICDEEEAKLHA